MRQLVAILFAVLLAVQGWGATNVWIAPTSSVASVVGNWSLGYAPTNLNDSIMFGGTGSNTACRFDLATSFRSIITTNPYTQTITITNTSCVLSNSVGSNVTVLNGGVINGSNSTFTVLSGNWNISDYLKWNGYGTLIVTNAIGGAHRHDVVQSVQNSYLEKVLWGSPGVTNGLIGSGLCAYEYLFYGGVVTGGYVQFVARQIYPTSSNRFTFINPTTISPGLIGFIAMGMSGLTNFIQGATNLFYYHIGGGYMAFNFGNSDSASVTNTYMVFSPPIVNMFPVSLGSKSITAINNKTKLILNNGTFNLYGSEISVSLGSSLEALNSTINAANINGNSVTNLLNFSNSNIVLSSNTAAQTVYLTQQTITSNTTLTLSDGSKTLTMNGATWNGNITITNTTINFDGLVTSTGTITVRSTGTINTLGNTLVCPNLISAGRFIASNSTILVDQSFQNSGVFSQMTSTVQFGTSTNTATCNVTNFYNVLCNTAGKTVALTGIGAPPLLVDASGNNNTGTNINGATSVVGTNGLALLFNGTNQGIVTTSNYNITANGASLCAWINYQNLATNTFLARSVTSVLATRFYFQVDPSGHLAFFVKYDNGTQYIVTNSTTLASNQWFFVSATLSTNGYVSLFTNGLLSASALSFSSSVTNNPAPLTIGKTVWEYHSGGGAPDYFRGMISKVSIYNRALSSNEVFQVYQGNAPTNGLVGYWPLDDVGASPITGTFSSTGAAASNVTWTGGSTLTLSNKAYLYFTRPFIGFAGKDVEVWDAGGGTNQLGNGDYFPR